MRKIACILATSLLLAGFIACGRNAWASNEQAVVDSEDKELSGLPNPAVNTSFARMEDQARPSFPAEVVVGNDVAAEIAQDGPPANLNIIHIGDKIKITVMGEKDLSDIYTVNSSGEVRFPLIEKIKAEGKSLNQFRENLQQVLGKDFINDPQVEVFFEESMSNSVMVLGRVNRPGNYSLPANAKFLQMISMAGGFDATAAISSCKVVRIGRTGSISIPVNVEAMINSEDPDLLLRPGDTIFVPKIASTVEEKDDYLNSVAVIGQVNKPGNYRLTEGMTMVRLLSQAGGLARGADAGKVTVTRKLKNGGQDTQIIDVKKIMDGIERDILLQIGDIVYVAGARTDATDIVNLSQAVTILGQVSRPRNYELVPGLDLVQLISEAGGFTPLADTSRVRIVRGESKEKKQIFVVNVGAIISGKADNRELQKGDIVYVPESVF